MSEHDKKLAREAIANRPKHWVRLVTACNNRCLFCLDMDTPRNVYLDQETIETELRRGFDELGATKVILSGGEASVHPLFPHFIRYALELGYDRVQTVTNGLRYGDKKFFDSVMEAGLGEITFSLHGHNARLHDHLVQCPGSFDKLIKGLVRAVRHRSRHGWPVVNIDVVINKQNVAFLDRIVELGIRMGIKEYDLLHVIPQAEAYRNRDEMFYDVREHLPVLQKVFRLNRRDDFHIWTNRFPVAFLEGMEDLIQDPHKMIDEVRGRKHHVRRYLDVGTTLECREADRCTHCFIEPFCTTMERTVVTQNTETCEVWDVGTGEWEGPLPFGAVRLGLEREQFAGVPSCPVRLRLRGAEPVEHPDIVLVARTSEQIQAWYDHALEIELNRETADWLLGHPLEDRHVVVQPSYETLAEATRNDVRDPAAFFGKLAAPVRVRGLPACAAPGMRVEATPPTLRLSSFDTSRGRLDWKKLAREHVTEHYRAKSARCADCSLTGACGGLHINMLRDQGLELCRPIAGEPVATEPRIATGMIPQPPAPSLPGFEQPTDAPEDPLRQKTGLRRSDFLRTGREVT
ncbi:MAG: radical SAM protein [Proteobacteria bacterium]|nr:radical SAM protein [Pseudomonadota bacterium]MCP4918826.1 radical SAM protein [Pseudomonadota bacterium]